MKQNKHIGCYVKPRYVADSTFPRAAALFHKVVRAVAYTHRFWEPGEVLYYALMDPTDEQRKWVENATKAWMDVCNITFVESPYQGSMLRIAFDPDDGSWSYLGTDNKAVPASMPTMNIGWEEAAIHEFGHALSLNHEHQNPDSGIIWDEEKVIADLSGPPNNWDLATIRHNVLDPLPGAVSDEFDPDSIMLYSFDDTWIKNEDELNWVPGKINLVISKGDADFMQKYYGKPILVDDPVVVTVPPIEPDDPDVKPDDPEKPTAPPKKKDKRIMYVIGGILAGLAVLAFILH